MRSNKKNTPKTPGKALLSWLGKHPELIERLEGMMEISKANGDGANSVDEFEQQMLQELDRMSEGLLHGWLKDKESHFFSRDIENPSLRKRGKKNCASTPFLEAQK